MEKLKQYLTPPSKTIEGGFINDRYVKFNRIAGVVTLLLIAGVFVFLTVWCVTGWPMF